MSLLLLALLQVEFKVDVSQAPETKDWAEKAKALCEEWWPKVAEALASDGWTPPKEVLLIFDPAYKGIAAASGTKIRISTEWIKKRPDDFGMVIHEMTHVVQAYPRGGPGWVTEGVADWIRYVLYEKKPLIAPGKRKGGYKDGYWTAASFLGWVAQQHDPKLIVKLNAAMRSGKWSDGIWKDLTGKELDALWAAYTAP